MIPLSSIHRNPANPRTITDERFKKLVKSITDFPKMMELRPIIVDENNIIQGGNQRRDALEAAGYTEVPESWVKYAKDFTPDELKEFIIKDNLSFGQWDWELLSNWDSEELKDWSLDVPNFVFDNEAFEDDYEIPDQIETDIVIGDLIEIGPHKLLCGDSTKPETFQKLFGEERADLVLTDPPYNVAYQGKTKNRLKIENDNQSDEDFYKFLQGFFLALITYVKPGGAWYVWHADSEGANFRTAMKSSGILLKQCLIWVKNAMIMGRQDYQWQHEPCLYGWKEGAAHSWYSDRKQTTILNFDKPTVSAEHPTMKPVKLFAYQISNSSKAGDIVADAFGGSGTTMVACEQLQRKAYVVESSPVYCQVIIDRMKKFAPGILIKKNGIEI